MQHAPTHLDNMLRDPGFRITPRRLAILKVLAQNKGLSGAKEIYPAVRESFPAATIAAVYKTPAVLKSVDEVLELEFSGDYNRCDGKKPHPHPHLICVKCRKIVDPEMTGPAGVTEKLVLESGYKLPTHRLDFYGICPQCQKSEYR